MDKNLDLRQWLQSWPYDPEDDVRVVRLPDGREVLQVRLPLGLEQYELEGRPDGQHPHGKPSVLEYHLERLADAERAGTASEFELSPEECAELFEEGTLFYYGYLHLFQAKDWKGTVRDTARNLQLFDFIHRYAAEEDDQMYLEQWRPYLLRMHGAAEAMFKLDQGEYAEALETVRATISQIEGLQEIDDETFQFERDRSLSALREMAEQIEESKPVSELESLERELKQAIETQHFERAATLRD